LTESLVDSKETTKTLKSEVAALKAALDSKAETGSAKDLEIS
jgi:hypothetical protein